MSFKFLLSLIKLILLSIDTSLLLSIMHASATIVKNLQKLALFVSSLIHERIGISLEITLG